MTTDLPVATLFDFIIGDFEDTWDALAARLGNLHRGNFLFARQAMTLLEVACRLCYSDGTGQTLKRFAAELARRDARYFTKLPSSCWTPSSPPEFGSRVRVLILNQSWLLPFLILSVMDRPISTNRSGCDWRMAKISSSLSLKPSTAYS